MIFSEGLDVHRICVSAWQLRGLQYDYPGTSEAVSRLVDFGLVVCNKVIAFRDLIQ